MFPIVISVEIWANRLANKCVTFHTDNQALVEVINKKNHKRKKTVGFSPLLGFVMFEA